MGPEVLEVSLAAEIFQPVAFVDAVKIRLVPAPPSLGGYGLATSEVFRSMVMTVVHLFPSLPGACSPGFTTK
jgi:hypothetical protein